MEENSYGVELGWAAIEEQRKIELTRLAPVDVPVGSGLDDNDLMMRWASEVQAASREQSLRLGQVVVFAVEPNRIRGAVLGKESDSPIPGVRILGARVKFDSDWGVGGRQEGLARYSFFLSTGLLFDQRPRNK